MTLDQYLWHLKCKFHADSSFRITKENIWGSWEVISSRGWDFLNSNYYEITTVFGFEMGKEWFKNYLLKEPNQWDNPYRKKKKGRWTLYWQRRWEAKGKPSAYRRNPEHEKKVLSEQEINKREWRKKKGISKDKSKAYYRRGAGKWYKKYSNTLHRQWEREMIHAEKWDEISDKDYKFFLDPWLWD